MLAKFIAWSVRIAALLSGIFYLILGIYVFTEDIYTGGFYIMLGIVILGIVFLPLQRWIDDALKAT